ncbi:hypothetical protein D1094_14895 [Colwellia sp. RSH04]|nr:hypothetical protein D1094_14895 [Colwellia sp. RSH04]
MTVMIMQKTSSTQSRKHTDNRTVKHNLLSSVIVTSLLITSFIAQAEDSSFEEAWQYVDLYKNEQGDYFKLSGRLQLDSAWNDAEQGEFNDTSWRRFRFGFKGKIGELTGALEADINLNKSFSDSYNRLTDANLSWAMDDRTKLTFLKHSAGFTMDGKTSSKKLLTPQRNNLTNNLWFTAEYFTGVSVKGKLNDGWTYNTGVFSSDDSDEIGFSDTSYFALFSVSKTLSKSSLWEQGLVSVDYVYNDTHEAGNTRDFSQVISFSSKFKSNKWHLDSDFSYGKGDLGQSDVIGFVIMPYYQQSKSIQWVSRYTYLNSKNENGVRLARYESSVTSGRGDNYQEIYAGVNWLANGHKFKIQAGVQYSTMNDKANDGGEYGGWGVNLALRTYW